jgi:hypothetical protein
MLERKKGEEEINISSALERKLEPTTKVIKRKEAGGSKENIKHDKGST